MATKLIPLAALVAVACGGGAQNAPPPSEPVTVVAPAPESPLALASEPPTASAPAGVGYAESSLTELARSVQAVTVAALEGRDPTLAGLPIERIKDPDRLVRSKGTVPPVRDLEFLAFAMEVRIVLSRDDSVTSGDADDVRAIEAVAFLSRTGLKLAQIRSRSSRDIRPLPPWLAGVEQFGSSVVQALRNHTANGLLVGEAERPLLGDALYEQAKKELSRVELGPLERAVALHPTPLGYTVDDVFLVARGPGGVIWGFQLQFDEDQGRVVLDSSPLVRVEKLEPERDIPPPPPAPAPPP